MAKIRIDSDGLRQNKQVIESKINELQSLNSRFSELLQRIDDSWEGVASQQYIAKMTMYRQKAEDMIGVLQEFKKYVEQAITQFEEKDRNSGSRIRNV